MQDQKPITTTGIEVRSAGSWLCECGSHMIYLDGPQNRQRRMRCVSMECPKYDKPVYEPIFKALPFAASATVL